jgi:hypothetical protein
MQRIADHAALGGRSVARIAQCNAANANVNGPSKRWLARPTWTVAAVPTTAERTVSHQWLRRRGRVPAHCTALRCAVGTSARLPNHCHTPTLYCSGTHSSTHPQVPKEKCEECKRIALDVIRVLKPTGPGGFDFLFQVGRCRKARLAHLSVPCMCLEARPRRDRPLGLTSLTTPSCHGCAPYRTGCRTSRTSTAAASTAGACGPARPPRRGPPAQRTPQRTAPHHTALRCVGSGTLRPSAMWTFESRPRRHSSATHWPQGEYSMGNHGTRSRWVLTGVLHGYSRGYTTQAVGCGRCNGG